MPQTMPQKPKDIEVEMTFLTTEEGGRINATFSGYRPHFHYEGNESCAIHEFIGVDIVSPGQTVKAYLAFLSPEQHVGKLSVGQEFLIREGARTVAKGHIVKILELDESANRVRSHSQTSSNAP